MFICLFVLFCFLNIFPKELIGQEMENKTLGTNEFKTKRKTIKKYIFMKTVIKVIKTIQLFTIN